MAKSVLKSLFFLHHMGTVIFPPDHREFNSRQILCPAPLDQHHVVFLQIVSLAGDKHHRLLAVGQTHAGALAVGRIGLLGFANHGFQHHRLQLRPTECSADFRRPKWGFALAVHLVQSGHGPGQEGGGPQGDRWNLQKRHQWSQFPQERHVIKSAPCQFPQTLFSSWRVMLMCSLITLKLYEKKY